MWLVNFLPTEHSVNFTFWPLVNFIFCQKAESDSDENLLGREPDTSHLLSLPCSSHIPTCTQPTSSHLTPHMKAPWQSYFLVLFFLFLFQVDNRNGKDNHKLSTENPDDFFKIFFPYGDCYFFFLNQLFSIWKSFCHKIDYQLYCFLSLLMPKKGLSWRQSRQEWCFLMYSAWLLMLEMRWKHLNHFPFQTAV